MDPVQVKVDQYSNNANPIAAQPVAAPYTTTNYGVNPGYSGTTATPVQHQPMVVQSVPTGYASGSPNPLFVQNGRQYPQGRWGDSICDWPTNLFPSCYCVCCFCCGMYLAAQSKSYEYFSFFFYRDLLIIYPYSCSEGWIFFLQKCYSCLCRILYLWLYFRINYWRSLDCLDSNDLCFLLCPWLTIVYCE